MCIEHLRVSGRLQKFAQNGGLLSSEAALLEKSGLIQMLSPEGCRNCFTCISTVLSAGAGGSLVVKDLLHPGPHQALT